MLVSRGRTTNEQVTGKFRTGVNPFDNGCISNWKHILFSSNAPSYIKFHQRQVKKREYLETKILLNMHTKNANANANNINQSSKSNGTSQKKKAKLKSIAEQQDQQQQYYQEGYAPVPEKVKQKSQTPVPKPSNGTTIPPKREKIPQQYRHPSEERQPLPKKSQQKRAGDDNNIWEDRRQNGNGSAHNHKVYSQHVGKKDYLLVGAGVASSSSSYSSNTNGSKYIRNNSYLNANPVVGNGNNGVTIINLDNNNVKLTHQLQQPTAYSSSSAASTNSSYLMSSNSSNNFNQMSNHNNCNGNGNNNRKLLSSSTASSNNPVNNHYLIKQKEHSKLIKKNSNGNNNNHNHLMPIEDYASYEITV